MNSRLSQPDVCATATIGTRPSRPVSPQERLSQQTDPRRVKLTVVGDGTVGKTCLLYAFVNRRCPSDEYMPTVFENTSVDSCVSGQAVQLSLWDTAGQEEYCRLRRLIYPSSDIFVLCYAVDNISSFDNIATKWWPELRSYCPTTPIVLVATKTDLRAGAGASLSPESAISSQQGRRLARRLRAAGFLECSARSYAGVQEVFDAAVRAVLAGDRARRWYDCSRWCRLL